MGLDPNLVGSLEDVREGVSCIYKLEGVFLDSDRTHQMASRNSNANLIFLFTYRDIIARLVGSVMIVEDEDEGVLNPWL
jgi:hypothetical protein